MTRRYEMTGRTAAMQRTRESILDAAEELFGPAWFDEVTLADVAKQAGVSQQTVVNHFGSKIGLYLTGISERFVPGVTALRRQAVAGDVGSIVATAMADYETSGDGAYRNVVLANWHDAVQPHLAELNRDQIHFGGAGARLFTSVLKDALQQLAELPPPRDERDDLSLPIPV